MPRSGIGLNDLLGRRYLAPRPACHAPTPGRTVQQVWTNSSGWNLSRPDPDCPDRAAENSHRQPTRNRLRMIVLEPKLRLSEVEVRHEWPPMPFPRVRIANATEEGDAASRSKPGYSSAANQRPNARVKPSPSA